MRTRAIDVRHAIGCPLFTPIVRPNGKKLFAKGHVLHKEDVEFLIAEGRTEVQVSELDEDEVGEDDAAMQIARAVGSGSIEIRIASGGRSNILSVGACCVVVDSAALREINSAFGIAVATVWNWTYAIAGQRVATVKSVPIAIAKRDLAAAMDVATKNGPVLQICSIRSTEVAVLYSDPETGDRARHLFERIMSQRLPKFGARLSAVLSVQEREEVVAKALAQLLRTKPACVLIASTTAPAGPADEVGRAMTRAGCRIESFLAPVEPGNLLLLGYKDGIPVVSAPGCFRSPKPTVVDLILPPMLAGRPVSARDIASLGPVGLLADV
jgi:molybdenum cofactor cytidylyltransferase